MLSHVQHTHDKTDALLSRLAKRLKEPPSKSGGDRAYTTVDVWGSSVAVASLGPNKPAPDQMKKLEALALNIGAILSPSAHDVPWIALDVSSAKVGGSPFNAVKVCKLVNGLVEVLSGPGILGCHLEISRGYVREDSIFGLAVDRAWDGAANIRAGVLHLAQDVVQLVQGLGVNVGTALPAGGHEVVLPVDSRAWRPPEGVAVIGKVLRMFGGGRLKPSVELHRSGYRTALSEAPNLRGDSSYRSLELSKAGQVNLLGHQQPLELECDIVDEDWAYLVLQFDTSLVLLNAFNPLRKPGQPNLRRVSLKLKEAPAVVRPILILCEQPLTGLEELLKEVQELHPIDAERQLGALSVKVSQQADARVDMADLGLWAHDFDPDLAWQEKYDLASALLTQQQFAKAEDALKPLLGRPSSSEKRAALILLYAKTLRGLRRPQDSLVYLNEVQSLLLELPRPDLLAETQLGLSRTFILSGDFDRALDNAIAAEAQFRAMDDREGQSRSLVAQAIVFRRQNNLSSAVQSYELALELLKSSPQNTEVAKIHDGLGQVNQDLGRVSEAKVHYGQALALFEAQGHSEGQMRQRQALGYLHQTLGHFEEAEQHLMAAFSLAEGSESGVALGQSHMLLGMLALEQQNLDIATNRLQEALQLLPTQAQVYRAGAHLCLVDILLRRGELYEAKQQLDAFPLANLSLPVDFRIREALVRAQLAKELKQGDRLEILETGIEAIEAVREGLPLLLRTRFLEASQCLFDDWIGCMYEDGLSPENILDGVERARGRAFLDAVVRSEKGRQGDEATDRFRLASWLPETLPKSVLEVQAVMPSDVSVLVYHCLSDQILAFWVNSDSVQHVSIEVDQNRLNALAEAARQGGRGIDEGARGASWIALSNLLLKEDSVKGWLGTLAPEAPLGIILHGPLYGIPIQALPSPKTGRPMVMDHSLFYLPSLQSIYRNSTLSFTPAQGMTILANSDKGLKFAEQEGLVAAKHQEQARIFSQENATLENLKANLPTSALVHLAVHARRSREGEPASLTLSAGGEGNETVQVPAQTLAELPVAPGSVFVLSACESGRGELSPAGDGPDLLSWSLLQAGSRSVLSTGWEVHDQATYEFMKLFYEAYANGDGLLLALTSAQRSFIARTEEIEELGSGQMRDENDWVESAEISSPTIRLSDANHWAAFSLLGDWR